jgi:hypothetical protein
MVIPFVGYLLFDDFKKKKRIDFAMVQIARIVQDKPHWKGWSFACCLQ